MKLKLNFFWGILDQALQSVVNFAIGLILIRYASKEEYGLYSMGFTAVLLMVGFSNAIVSTQMTLITPSKEKAIQDVFCGSLIIGFYKYLLSIIFIISSYIPFARYLNIEQSMVVYFSTLMLTSPVIIFQEIMRTYFYLKHKPKLAFMMDLLFAIIYAILMYGVVLLGYEDMHIYTFAANGLSAMLATLIFFMCSDLKFKGALRISSNSLNEAWTGGKWAMGGVLVTWGQNQSYVYVLALLKGAELVAEANAARLFLAPIGLVSTSISKVIMPRLAQLKANNQINDAVSIARKLLFMNLAFITLYVVTLSLSIDWIIDNFTDKNYTMINLLIYSWAIYFLCQSFRNNNSIILQVLRLFKKITLSNLWTAILTLTASMLVAIPWGVQGIIFSMCIGELLLAIILLKIYKNERHKY